MEQEENRVHKVSKVKLVYKAFKVQKETEDSKVFKEYKGLKVIKETLESKDRKEFKA